VVDEDEDAAAVSAADALDVVLGTAEGEDELPFDVVVVPAPADVVVVPASADVVVVACPFPELAAGGGGDWPEGRTTYVQSLSSRMDCAPLLSVVGVRVTLHVCVIVPT
jgi:hypothetical protein